MAATVTVEKTISLGGTENLYLLSIAFDSSYPTGGEALDGTGNETFLHVQAQATSGYVFQWDPANQKLLAYYADNDAGADSALIQVPNTTDLSALTAIKALAVGQ